MQFQRIKQPTKQIEDMFLSYCLISKPYDFCHMPSRHMSILKIKEYMRFLFEKFEVYIGIQNQQIKLLVAIATREIEAVVEFIFGSPFGFMDNFACFRSFYQKVNPEIKKFSAHIARKHKLKSFLNFITKKDPQMQIILDKQEIAVLWNS